MPDSTNETHTTIASVKLVICNALKQVGIDPAPLCAAAGLKLPDMLHPMRRDNTSKVAQLMTLAIEASDDPDFVLQVARRFNISTFASYGGSLIKSPSLATALQRGQHFSELVTGFSIYEIITCDKTFTARLSRLRSEGRTLHDLELLYLAGGLQIGRSLKSISLLPLEVRLTQNTPKNTQSYRSFFDCPVLFEQTENSITMREESPKPLISAQESQLSEVVQNLTQIDFDEAPARSVADEVCIRVANTLAEGEPKIAAVAGAMGLSPRSLQRKLAAENHTFARLLDNTRKRLAHEMVLKPTEQIKNLAYDLGFSDQSNFNRAFKRWFSMSPTEYRRKFSGD